MCWGGGHYEILVLQMVHPIIDGWEDQDCSLFWLLHLGSKGVTLVYNCSLRCRGCNEDH